MESAVPAHRSALGENLVGRNRERTALQSLLGDAARSLGHIALISGTAGIGKSALVGDLVRFAEEGGYTVLLGASYDGLAAAPYEPWYDALIYGHHEPAPSGNGLVSYLEAVAPGDTVIENEQLLTRTLLSVLKELVEERPGLLVLEDLHWADTASIELLLRVARSIRGLPLLIAATWRVETGVPFADAPAVNALARDPSTVWLALERLGDEDIAAWLRRLYRLDGDELERVLKPLVRYADGNPLFVHEILRELESSNQLRLEGGTWRVEDLSRLHVPPIVQQLITSRLDVLPADTRELLAIAAVLGQAFPASLLHAVSGYESGRFATAIAGARESMALRPAHRSDRFEFQHALIRDVLYQQLVSPIRRDLHRRAADELLATANPDADHVARHLLEANDERAADWLLRAGDRAERAYAWNDAVKRFQQALDVLPVSAATDRLRGWLSFRIGYLSRYGDLGRARNALDAALECAHVAQDRTLLAYTRYAQGVVNVFAGSWQRGIDDLLAAVRLLEHLPGPDRLRLNAFDGIFNPDVLPLPTSRFGLPDDPASPAGPLPGDIDRRATVGALLAESGHLDEALELLESCRAAIGDSERRTGHILQASAYVHALAGRPADSARDFDEASRDFEGAARALMLLDCHVSRLIVLSWTYRADQASERREQLAVAARIGARLGEFQAPELSHDHWLVYSHFLEGRWDTVEQLVRTPGLSSHGGRYHPHIFWVAALLMRERGEPERAWVRLRDLLPDGTRSEPGNAEFLTSTRAILLAADLALDSGDLGAAERWLTGHSRWMEWSGAILGAADAELRRARLARALGDEDEARNYAYRALAGAIEPRQPLSQAGIQRFIAALDLEAGDYDAARERLDRAISVAEYCGVAHELLACRITETALLAGQGELTRAREVAAAVRAGADTLGARRLLGLLDGIKLDPDSEALDLLTEREREVLAQVALGLTDAEVGDRLFIATRTVNAHMRSIRSKLAVDSRLRAVQVARERGLI